VPHDPLLYFHGEEITIAVRAFTYGYDLFHPNEIIAWHEYTREGRTKHWDDDKQWNDKNLRAHSRTRSLLGVDGEVCTPCNSKSFEGYNIGDQRTIADYELYSGIRFKDRLTTNECTKNSLPPGNLQDTYLLKFNHVIDFKASLFKLDDYDFAALIFTDNQNQEIYRRDYTDFNFILTNPKITVSENIPRPYAWIIWAYSKSKGWAEKIHGII
jgi:hypothetical protein